MSPVGWEADADERQMRIDDLKSRVDGPISGNILINDDLDATVFRFLKARQGDVGKAAEMLNASIKWRRENKIDSVLSRPLNDEKFFALIQFLPNTHMGRDKRGWPVYIDRTGMVDMGKLLKWCSQEEVVHAHIMMMEYQNQVLMREASEAAGRTVNTMSNFMDLTGASLRMLSKASMDVFSKVAEVDQNNYPELMGSTYVINAPWVFATIWKAVRIFLDQNTQNKVHILKAGKETDEVLDEVLEPEHSRSVRAFLSGEAAEGAGDERDEEGLTPGQRRFYEHVKCEVLRSQGLINGGTAPEGAAGGAEAAGGGGGAAAPREAQAQARGAGDGGELELEPAGRGPGAAAPAGAGKIQAVQGALLGIL